MEQLSPFITIIAAFVIAFSIDRLRSQVMYALRESNFHAQQANEMKQKELAAAGIQTLLLKLDSKD